MFQINDEVIVKLSDAPEFEAEVLDMNDDGDIYIRTTTGKTLWVRERLCRLK